MAAARAGDGAVDADVVGDSLPSEGGGAAAEAGGAASDRGRADAANDAALSSVIERRSVGTARRLERVPLSSEGSE